jgi:carboxyl-terminal processing protease
MLQQGLNKLEGKQVVESKSYSERKLAQNKPPRSASAPVVAPPALPATPGSAPASGAQPASSPTAQQQSK